jgi:hypothetical protein
MSYFKELPNLQVKLRFPNQSSNKDYVTIKNLWKRAKLREDVTNAVTAFNYYQIEGNDRPDQIAEKVYGDPELDWVVLITNNITNINSDWPLSDDSLYKYLIDKYGNEEALQEIHHTETTESRDRFNRLVIPGGLKVDPDLATPSEFNTTITDDEYRLDGFPAADNLTTVSVDLIQALNVKQRDFGDVLYLIPDIKIETSELKVYTRSDDILDIRINNDLVNNWPSSWGGTLRVIGRNGTTNITIEDVISDTIRIIVPDRLYEVVGEFDLESNTIVPIFRFRYVELGG